MASPLSLAKLTRPPVLASTRHAKPPLLVLLHGYGSHQHDLFELTPALDPRFFVISLRAPYTLTPGSYSWFGLQPIVETFTINEAEAASSVAQVVQFIKAALDEFDADPSQVYLMGFSQGAMISAAVALEYPGLVQGLVLMSGQLLPHTFQTLQASPVSEKECPAVIITHGTQDPLISVQHARAARAFLESRNIALTYHEYDMRHQLTQECFEDVRAWLMEHLDSATTSHFSASNQS